MVKNLTAEPVYAVRLVMDPRVIPLRQFRPAQRFQVMCVLGTMWTMIFCLGTGSWLYYDELVIFHLLVACGTLVTAVSFFSVSRPARTYRDFPVPDGTARYDDVWGG